MGTPSNEDTDVQHEYDRFVVKHPLIIHNVIPTFLSIVVTCK